VTKNGGLVHTLPEMENRAAPRGTVHLLILVVIITRIGLVYLADNPDHYGTPGSKVVGDVDGYRLWADKILDEDLYPYADFPIEYPPAVIPFALVAEVGPETSYRLAFILLMVLVDLAGLWAIYRMGVRDGSLLGPWLWVFGIAAAGPILYCRLDLIPAVATILAFERASAAKWGTGGAWLGFGIASKIYPVLLLPLVALMARRKLAVIGGAAAVVVVALLPFVGSLDSVFTSVFGYHTDRGIQIESTWAAGVQIAGNFGYPLGIEYTFGAFHLASAVSPTLKTIANGASLLALGVGIGFALRFARRNDAQLTAEVAFATLALILGLGTVFSPQFIVWLLALAAVVACNPRSYLVVPAMAALPLCAMTQLIYPFMYDRIIIGGSGRLYAQLLLLARDLGVLALGVTGFWILARRRWRPPEREDLMQEPEPRPV
jgi:hypothetical protein